mmetsp:Transcript_20865/g.71938  ORF Transcript_20865/g.71938 Transcript_20865/m.71938 type:complete len:200 (+) Transcript_20865:16-615(+)
MFDHCLRHATCSTTNVTKLSPGDCRHDARGEHPLHKSEKSGRHGHFFACEECHAKSPACRQYFLDVLVSEAAHLFHVVKIRDLRIHVILSHAAVLVHQAVVHEHDTNPETLSHDIHSTLLVVFSVNFLLDHAIVQAAVLPQTYWKLVSIFRRADFLSQLWNVVSQINHKPLAPLHCVHDCPPALFQSLFVDSPKLRDVQ